MIIRLVIISVLVLCKLGYCVDQIDNVGQVNEVDHVNSIVTLDHLHKLEGAIIESIENCILQKLTLFEHIKPIIEKYKIFHQVIGQNASDQLLNPVIAYLLIRRLTYWKRLKDFVLENGCQHPFLESETLNKYLPNNNDLTGAALALMRLQQIYKLNTTDLANGIVSDVDSGFKMDSADCFEVGLNLHNSSEYKYANLWLFEALYRIEDELNEENLQLLKQTLGYISSSYYNQGHLVLALQATKKLLKIAPTDDRAIANKAVIIEQLLKWKKLEDLVPEKSIDSEEQHEKQSLTELGRIAPVPFEKVQYRRLCRNEIHRSPAILSKLHCRFVNNFSAYSKIAPFKLEEISLDPYIVIYHNVIYDTEIEVLKNLSLPILHRSGVKAKDSDVSQHLNVRTSKIAFLNTSMHKYVEDIDFRVKDMTGLSIEYAEPLQVVNYGIGGHYEPHWDFFDHDGISETVQLNGNRIATVLFYFNNIEQGGATVFPYLNISLWPEKGSAAFWYNLHASGDTDFRTRHAACPVIIGTKWASNKWIRERNQEFLRKCDVEDDSVSFQTLMEDLENTLK